MPQLLYNSHHVLADHEPHKILRHCSEEIRNIVRGFGDDVEEMIERANLPVYVHFTEDEELEDYDMDIMIQQLGIGMALWDGCFEHKVLLGSLRKMVTSNAAQVTNIVCIGHGGFGRELASIMQHIVASSIAKELASLYVECGKPLATPITITAQDPAYSASVEWLLSRLPTPIQIVVDPEGFLEINESSFVMSCYPVVPVKQMIADLATDSTAGKGPAAVMTNNSSWDDKHGGVDVVTYLWTEVVYFANPGSRRWLDMLKIYEKMMDGSEAFGNRFTTGDEDEDDEKDTNDSGDEVYGLVHPTDNLTVRDGGEESQVREDDNAMEGGTSAAGDAVVFDRASDDEAEGQANTEDKLEDATKGVPGFS